MENNNGYAPPFKDARDLADNVEWRSYMGQNLGRLEGKIDQLLAVGAVQRDRIADHETRIRVLEKGMWKRLGFVGAGSGLGGAMIGLMIKTGVIPT